MTRIFPRHALKNDPTLLPSRRRSPLALGFALTAMLLSGCRAEGSMQETTQDTAVAGSPSAPPSIGAPPLDSVAPPASPAADEITPPGEAGGDIPASTQLTAEGWGPLRIGMTRQEVVAAAGEDANPNAVGGPDPATCDEFRPLRAPAGLLVMIESGRLTRISVGSSSRVETDRGIGIGDDPAEVRRAYGDSVESTPHKYVAAPAAYMTVWTVAPPAPDARGLQYEVGPDGRISRIHAGGPSIQYVEGCL